MKTINSFRSKLFALTFALMASVSSFAYEFQYVNDFHIDGLAYKIISANTPDEGEGYVALIEIADCKKDVIIPEYVSYGDRGFYVTTFGMGSIVFTNEASSVVESITIPETTYIINKNALAGCQNLKVVAVDSENPYYDSRENCNAIITTSQNPYFTPNTLIAGCKTTTIPNSVVEIGENAFYNCQSLETITIPNSVTKIDRSAFNACAALSSITLSENLTAIGEWAFDDCNNLLEVICYAPQPPTISNYTFSGVSPTVYVPAESIERYRAANGWKDLQIKYISWSEECEEYKHVNMSVVVFGNSIIFDLSNNHTIEPPYVDSVWIVNTEQEPVRKLYAQSGDTIDVSFLEERGHYILNVYIDGCRKSRTFVYRLIQNKWKDIWCDTWNVMWFDGMRFDETARTSKYRLGKDTVIGDYTYSKFTSRTSVRFTNDRKVYVYYEGFDDNNPYTPDLPTGEYLAYDFSAQVGDTLEVFSGIGTYSTYPCVVDDVQIDSETNLRTMTLHKICRIEDDGFFEEYDDMEMTWIEGVGSPEGFLISYLPCGWVGGGTYALLCAYQDDELKYTGSLYERFGCDYKAGVVSDDLFPTLSGLQRTICREYCEQADNKTRIEQFTNLTTRTETGGPYLYYSPFLLREKDNKIMIYSRSLNKDLVLYDFNLQVGDSLPMLYIDFFAKDDWIADSDMEIWCIVDYHKDLEGNILPADTLIVTDVSAITLLDGKEYKKWTFNNGMEYVEGIGSFGNGQWSGDFFQLIANKEVPTCLLDEHLVCASKNGQLLYQMDDTEMERLGAECLCDYNSGPKKDNAKEGKIGGRPTPTQWNMLEVETKEMDGTPTILRAETFSYTLENDSIVTKGKTFYQLARQSTKDTAITKSFVGALHFGEDEDNRVYFLRDGVEYVLYDFTAKPGDTIEIFAGINNYPQETTYTHVVTGKDTLENGACRMMLEVVLPEETASIENAQKVWLAGLGSIDGIVHNAATRATKARSSDTQTSIMLCAWRDDDCLYTTDHPDFINVGCEYNVLTAVEDIQTSGDKYQKIIRDGHLYILRDGKIYDVLGTPLN